jgi:zinc-ribbon domain
MAKFCISCGAELREGARFCGSCGAPVAEGDMPATGSPSSVAPLAIEPLPATAPLDPAEAAQVEPVYLDAAATDSPAERSGPNWLLIGGGAGILLLLLLYYLIFIRDDVSSPVAPATTSKIEAKEVEGAKLYAVADANIRNKATTVGTQISGKLLRGTATSGTVITGEDGTTPWLELDDGKGFVAMSNLSETEPPAITKALGDRIWAADQAMDIFAAPDSSAAVLDRVALGTPLTLFGLTGNDYIEIKLKKGGVGYLADGARIAEASNVKGKPIAISFNPATCNFGGELEVEFTKLAAKSRAAYDAVDKVDYPSDAAREQALGRVEGKSYYQRLERSFNGISITGIAQHYESQSLYFADAPDKVIAAFRAAGHKIGRDGQFPATEIYAGIGATAGEGRGYGKTDLSCGV